MIFNFYRLASLLGVLSIAPGFVTNRSGRPENWADGLTERPHRNPQICSDCEAGWALLQNPSQYQALLLGSPRERAEAAPWVASKGTSAVSRPSACRRSERPHSRPYSAEAKYGRMDCGRSVVSSAHPGSLTFVHWIWVKRLVTAPHKGTATQLSQPPGGAWELSWPSGPYDFWSPTSNCEPYPGTPSHAAATTLGTGTRQHWSLD